MYERFTVESRAAVVLAEEFAQECLTGMIGVEHLLYALLAENLEPTSTALTTCGFTQAGLRERFVAPAGIQRRAFLAFTAGTQRVLGDAVLIAVKTQSNYVRPEHLLLSLLAQPRGADTSAEEMVTSLLVMFHTTREAVRVALFDELPELLMAATLRTARQ